MWICLSFELSDVFDGCFLELFSYISIEFNPEEVVNPPMLQGSFKFYIPRQYVNFFTSPTSSGSAMKNEGIVDWLQRHHFGNWLYAVMKFIVGNFLERKTMTVWPFDHKDTRVPSASQILLD